MEAPVYFGFDRFDLTTEAREALEAKVPLMTATKALQDNLAALARKHSTRELPHERTSMDAFKTVVGYEEVVALQERSGS